MHFQALQIYTDILHLYYIITLYLILIIKIIEADYKINELLWLSLQNSREDIN